MRLNRANVLTMSLLVELTVSVVGSEPVTMYVKQEATSVNYLYINFYNDTFNGLYDCMTDTDNGQCNVHTGYEASGKPHPGNNWKATSVMPLRTANLDRGYFTCLYNQSVSVLRCTRYNTGQCEKDKCVSFRLQGSSICDNQCVHLMLAYSDEELLLNSTTDRFEYCDQVCTTTSVYVTTVYITKPSSHPSVTSRPPSDRTSEATTNSSSAAGIASTSSRKRSPAKQLPIIIGVVCSLVVIIIVVVVIGIMYRRSKLIKGPAGNNDISSPHTDTNYNGGHGQRSLSSTRNVSNKPDVLNSLPDYGRGRERNEESEDGYYTIDKDLDLNRYENALNTVSTVTSHIHGGYSLSSQELQRYQNVPGLSSPIFRIQEQDNSQLPHTREGDYFVLSENDHDKDSGSVNEERDLDSGYSLAKDVNTVDVIDVSSQAKDVSAVDVIDVRSQAKDVSTVDVIDVRSQAKNVYSRFRNDDIVRNNPYDMLLQPHEILNSRKTSIDVTQMKGTVDDKNDAEAANTTIGLLETASRSQAPKTLLNMTRDTTVVFPEYSTVNKTKT